MLQNPVVEKENLAVLHFAGHEVLTTEEEKNRRAENLHRAMILGNAFHQKVKIAFTTADETVLNVETTVWYASDKYVILKGGRGIPVSCIKEVEI